MAEVAAGALSAMPAKPASPARRRKLSTAHFAFIRGLVQGLPMRDLWDRYLHVEGNSQDLRVVRSTISWIRDEFAAAARREDRHGTARLVLLDPSRIPDDAPSAPSLEEFAADRGLEDFSQAEQLEAYEFEYGKASHRQSRRARLIQRQLDALRWLEALVAQRPSAGDSVAAWMHPSLADRLEAADIFTLAQLVERINGVGLHWSRGVRGVGAAKAKRIVQWLGEHQDGLGLSIGAHVALPAQRVDRRMLEIVVPAASDVRPLEKLVVPVELRGENGVYRLPQQFCMLEATNDYAALLAWLQSKHGLTPEQVAVAKARQPAADSRLGGPLSWLEHLSNTQRSYRKEAERFLLWAVIERKKPLSSMTTEDCIAYRAFLADPQPSSRWCGDRARPRWSPLWRPFEGPLSAAAQRQAVTILSNMHAFWAKKNYTRGNPWEGVSIPRSALPRIQTGRSFTMAQWKFVRERAAELGDTSAAQRLRFVLSLLYCSGLRLSEVVAARLDDLEWVEYPPDPEDDDHVEGWWLRVIGKGQKERVVPLAVDVVAELSAYLRSRGLDPDPEASSNRDVYVLGKAVDRAERGPRLLAPVDARSGIAASTLYDQLKAFFGDCGAALGRTGDARGAERLARASTHWLRHTHASHSLSKGTRIEIEQQILGHASLGTTTVYVTTEDKRRMKAAAAFWNATR